MAGSFTSAEHLTVSGIDRCECAAPKSDEETVSNHIVADVVRIVAQRNRPARMEVVCVDELHAVTLAVRDGDELSSGARRSLAALETQEGC